MSKGWSHEELDASVHAYFAMRDAQRGGKKVVKKTYYRILAERFNRSEKAFEYRMQNISYVLSTLGRDWLSGLKPAKNVGSQMATQIEAIIRQIEYQQTAPITAGKVHESPNLYTTVPSGVKSPASTTAAVIQYARDPAVKAWVHNQANGYCEACNKAAPFTNSEGAAFLEVHHVRPLASGGSDTISNAVALCPNCHRALHHSHEAKTLTQALYATVARLVRE